MVPLRKLISQHHENELDVGDKEITPTAPSKDEGVNYWNKRDGGRASSKGRLMPRYLVELC